MSSQNAESVSSSTAPSIKNDFFMTIATIALVVIMEYLASQSGQSLYQTLIQIQTVSESVATSDPNAFIFLGALSAKALVVMIGIIAVIFVLCGFVSLVMLLLSVLPADNEVIQTFVDYRRTSIVLVCNQIVLAIAFFAV